MESRVAPDAAFVELAEAVLEEILELRPELATQLGDHRYDDRLDDLHPDALDRERRRLRIRLAQLSELDRSALSPEHAVDAAMLDVRLRARLLDLEEIRPHEWDPLVANPGNAIYLLLARDFAPLAERLRNVASRLTGVADRLATARRNLGTMPRVAVETALTQFAGTRALLSGELERALAGEPALRREVDPPRRAALSAIDEHLRWLAAALPEAWRDPRLGADLFSRKLELTLDSGSGADAVLARAEARLERVEEEITQTAARISGRPAGTPGMVREVLDVLATQDAVDDESVLPRCVTALGEATRFVEAQQLVTVHDDPTEVIVMPEIHRGVAVAYCDPPGPLETRRLPTYFAVSPTPGDWPPERVTSFYREYNAHMLHNLTVHEAMPGHVVQLGHSARALLPTRVRRAFWSGPFVEGWAVYAEQLMVDRGYRADVHPQAADALRMQQLKMQLRMTINAILDARVHAHGMTEAEAMRLMTERGHQEEGEAVGKWRRALLTSAQLSTYFVGFTELSEVVAARRAGRPEDSDRAVHDAVLAHGSPAPRHLPGLLPT